ncbi:ECF transporter S component, partial [Lactiplantibacillus plantarum]
NTILEEADLFCPNSVRINFTIYLYHEPANKVYLQGVITWIADSISVAIIGTILLVLYARTRTQRGSLTKER